MKHTTGWLKAGIGMVMVFPLLLSGAYGASLALGTAANAGGTVSIPVVLKAEGDAVSAVSCDITFDAAALANPRVTAGPAAQSADKTVAAAKAKAGTASFSIFGMNNTRIGDGVVATVVFDVIGKGGTTGIKVTGKASDPDGKALSIAGAEAAVSFK